jgi:hypothetical protein
MTTSQEVEDVKARLAQEQGTLRQRIAEQTERLHRIAFAAENGDSDAIRERSTILAERMLARQRLEEVATALASADLMGREAEHAAARAEREAAMREAQGVHAERLRIAARLDEAMRHLEEAWCEFTATNGRMSPLVARAGLQPFVGRHDAGWLMRAIWHLAPEVARQVRLAPQLRPFSQPLAASVAQRAPTPAQEPTEQETTP